LSGLDLNAEPGLEQWNYGTEAAAIVMVRKETTELLHKSKKGFINV
jgi:hypothetical protein